MDMRDWLAIIVIVVVILILLDGFRRRWLDRKNRVLIKIDKNIPAEDDGYDYGRTSELPGEGVRTSPRDDLDPYYGSSEQIDEEDINEEGYEYEDEDESEEYDEDINADDNFKYERIEPSFSEEAYSSPEQNSNTISETEDVLSTLSSAADELDDDDSAEEPNFSQADFLIEEDSDEEGAPQQPSEVIIINVMAKKSTFLSGKEMLPLLLQLGLRLGDMSIFHRHADTSGEGPIMFSMANMVEPGTFDLANMDELATPGISFFLQLPNSLGNMQSFEKMLEATSTLKDKLGADLKDENRSVITRQTIEHCRQRILDFELAQLANK